jgi:hypothetical protein
LTTITKKTLAYFFLGFGFGIKLYLQPNLRSKRERNWSITRLAIKKTTLKGKMCQTLDNSITPAASAGDIEAMRPSVKK